MDADLSRLLVVALVREMLNSNAHGTQVDFSHICIALFLLREKRGETSLMHQNIVLNGQYSKSKRFIFSRRSRL